MTPSAYFSRMGAHAALLVALLATQSCGSDHEGPTATGTLSGRVSDAESGNGLADVTISIGGQSAQSDQNGIYLVTQVPVGEQSVTASLEGYQTFTGTVSITPGASTDLQIPLIRGTGIPATPIRLSASAGPETGSIFLEWERVSRATAYVIYWSTTPGVTPETGSKLASMESSTYHTSLTPGTTYYYVITSFGIGGESAPSAEVHAVARGDIGVTLRAPAGTGFVDTIVTVEAEVASAFEIDAVTASVGALSAPLSFDPSTSRWRGQLSLAALASPATVLIQVAARDVNGNTGDASVTERYDRLPLLTLLDPVNGAVGRPTFALRATCSDDSPEGCLGLTVVEEETKTVLFSGAATLTSSFSLAAYDGRWVYLEIRATDAAGQMRVVPRYVFVETSPALTEVASAGSGIILDADASRLLVNNVARRFFGQVGADTVRLVNRATRLSTPIFLAESTSVTGGLTPDGALLVTKRNNVNQTQVRELRNGVLSTLADVDVIYDFEIEGSFAVWLEFDHASWRLRRRDLTSGTTIEVATLVVNQAVDLAPNGDVVYVKTGEVFRFHGGTSEQLTDNAAIGLTAKDAATDGTHVIETTRPLGPVGNEVPVRSILLDEGGGDVVLATAETGQCALDYLLDSGWITFTRCDTSAEAQVWVRSPAGVETQLSFFGSSSEPRLMNGSGEVIFGRYRASPNSPATQFLESAAAPLYIDGVLHAIFGASLFRVN